MLLLLLFSSRGVAAQDRAYFVQYRPPGIRYLELRTPHFDIIFEEGLEEEAREAADVLEASLPATKALVGTNRQVHMPVVLNGFNDRANGYVTPVPFKQEIEGIRLTGDLLSPRTSSWIRQVTVHELAHAVQAEQGRGVGIGALVRPFAPDLVRAINLWMPPGVSEGLAVYRESEDEPSAGRLNHSLFQMQFRAAMTADRPWRLSQMLEVPAYTRPFDRYYLGGAHLFQYLETTGERGVIQRAMALHYRFPLLGFGVEWWIASGTPPWRLGRRVRHHVREEEARRLASLGSLTNITVIASKKGTLYRRPQWLDAKTLLVYAQGYTMRPGFYRLNVRTRKAETIAIHTLSEDFYFSLGSDSTTLLFSRYVPDALVPAKAIAEVYRVDISSGKAQRLLNGRRVLAPVPAFEGGVWALRNHGQFNAWVRLQEEAAPTQVSALDRSYFKALAPSPSGSMVAVLINVRGRQGLLRATVVPNQPVMFEPWLSFADGSIYDMSWSRSGRYLFFSADPTGVANIYVFDGETDRLFKLTNVAYGALEPSLSPDGGTLAFVDYQHERYRLVTMPFTLEGAEEIPRAAWQAMGDVPKQAKSEVITAEKAMESVRAYNAIRHLTPRMFYPQLQYDLDEKDGGGERLGVGVGLGVQGTDPLERIVYLAEATFQKQRLWGSLFLQSGHFLLRPSLRLFDEPSSLVAQVRDDRGALRTTRIGRERRGVSLGLRLPVLIHADVFQTSLALSLSAMYEQERFFLSNDELQPFEGRVSFSPAATLAFRLQSNVRDLVPNTGLVWRASAEMDTWTESGPGRLALRSRGFMFLPWLKARNVGLRLDAGLLTQNRGGLYNLSRFLPRGYDDVLYGAGIFTRYGFEATLPLRYVDNGLVLLPLYIKALYSYVYAEGAAPLEGAGRPLHSLGAGLGLQFRLFYNFDLELQLGTSYRVEERDWTFVVR